MFTLLAEAGAGGAALTEVIAGTVVGGALVLIAVVVGAMHRHRRISWLHALSRFSERTSGLPGWAALPAAIAGVALQLALFGFWWDVATHIDNGRDDGAFGNLAHWPILVGLFGIALAGFLAVTLGCDERERTAVRLRSGWSVPLGGIMLLASGGFALSGFPLDDTWHRLFGQDVTLWGPTHVLMIASASLATLGVWCLLVEGRRSARRTGLRDAAPSNRSANLIDRLRGPSIAGGFLIALSTLQGEFDFGVPQYSLLLHPVMLMIAAGCGLVAARIVLGRFGALQAVGFYLLLRSIITLTVDQGFDLSLQHFPLYVVEALLVEAAAWRLGTDRPLRLGVVAGALIGTIGLAAEWGWTHVWMPIPWPESILPEAAILGLVAALGAGVLGAYVGGTLSDSSPPARIGPGWVAALAGAAVLVAIAYPIPRGDGIDARAQVTLQEIASGERRAANLTVRIEPAAAARDAVWVNATAWQGGGLVVRRLEEVSEGVFRTTSPLPLHGEWKSLVRLSDGRSLEAVPVYLPADPAIPAEEVPAPASFEREFVSDKSILQREAKEGFGWLNLPAHLLLGLIMFSEIGLIAWGLTRLRRSAAQGPGRSAPADPSTTPSDAVPPPRDRTPAGIA